MSKVASSCSWSMKTLGRSSTLLSCLLAPNHRMFCFFPVGFRVPHITAAERDATYFGGQINLVGDLCPDSYFRMIVPVCGGATGVEQREEKPVERWHSTDAARLKALEPFFGFIPRFRQMTSHTIHLRRRI